VRAFRYDRPTSLAGAIDLLSGDKEALVLAGGTDLIIRLRDATYRPAVVVDVKHIPEFAPEISAENGFLRFSAGTTMTDVLSDDRARKHFPALAEAARFVGSVQIRNRATLAANM
jgi:CO/xanthine dehydrogenase FAD-binding subunit